GNMTKRQTVLAALFASMLSGCGTVCNLAGAQPDHEPRVYGGVSFDFEVMDQFVQDPPHPTNSDPRGGVLLLALALVAQPLSFVGDTLTLPITIYLQNKRSAERSGEPAEAATGVTLGKPSPMAAAEVVSQFPSDGD